MNHIGPLHLILIYYMLSHLLRAYFEERWSNRNTASTMLKVSRMSPPSLFRQSPGHRMGQTVALIGALVSTVKEWNKSNSRRRLIPGDGNFQIFSETVGICPTEAWQFLRFYLCISISERRLLAKQMSLVREQDIASVLWFLIRGIVRGVKNTNFSSNRYICVVLMSWE